MEQTEIFLKERKEHFKFMDINLKNKRDKFISWMLVKNWNPPLKVCEMYKHDDKILKNSWRIPQYPHEYSYCNTRFKLPSETRAEIDNLPFDKAIDLICKICLELMKNGYHFAVFYAEGQRSPHIIIYDFYELIDLKPHQREKAQIEFWRSLIPFHFQNLDRGIWLDKHPVPIEFFPHWKYRTPFKLIMEWLP